MKINTPLKLSEIEQALAELSRWVCTCGLSLGQEELRRLRAYMEALLIWNKKIALVSQQSPAEIVHKHFADSLFAAAHCGSGNNRIVDLGSGAGFPGLPIAIARPESAVCLIESKAKKVSFLSEAIRLASLTNARVFHGRIESASTTREHSGSYTLVTSRALTSLQDFLQLAAPFLRSGGQALSMKGSSYERELDSTNWQACGFDCSNVIPYELPDRSKRVLLVFRFT